jgi:CheY-like chemotaxis protein
MGQGHQLPQLKVWVDRDPMLLLLTSRPEFAQRLAEAFSRKFGLASLDYIKGAVLPELGRIGGGTDASPAWGRIQMILVHNQLRLVSPLDLTKQLVDKERCPLPILLLGTEEDEDKKRHHAATAGAVDYIPVEPFRVLAVLRKVDETLKLFEGA